MTREHIQVDGIYPMTWEYSAAIKVTGGSLVFISGIVGAEADGSLPAETGAQAKLAFANLEKVIQSAGGSMRNIVKVNVYVGEDYQQHRAEIREVRARHFAVDFPCSTLVRVDGFANPDYKIEVEAIAALD